MENQVCELCSKNLENIKNDIDCLICAECLEEQTTQLRNYEESRVLFFPEINKITEKIYLGNQDAAKDLKLLQENGITHVLVCAAFLGEYHPDKFIYKTVALDDDPNEKITLYFKETIEFIEQAERVYVHCHAGLSRSPSIVIGYIMWKNKLSFNEAKDFLKKHRPAIIPNSGFEWQLTKFESYLKKNNYIL